MARVPALRRATQALAFVLFSAAAAWPALGSLERLFFRADPLAMGAAAVAGRGWPVALGLALGLIALTLACGRVFCGWACPLGALFDFLDHFTGAPVRAVRLSSLKYHLLLLLTCLAVGGIFISWALDPLYWAAQVGGLTRSVTGPRHLVAVVLLIVFSSLLLGRRGFCRVVCPLGALLGLVARVSLFRRSILEQCTGCGTCVRDCRMAAISADPEHHDRSECVHCHECDASCPVSALRFAYRRPRHPEVPFPPRREYLATLAGGVALALGMQRFGRVSPALRPPGAAPDVELRQRCIRCGSCVRACPTGALRPAGVDAGPLAFELPVLVGACAWDCNACGQVCPTVAIRELPLAVKRRWRIGRAVIDGARCGPHARGEACLWCYAACPRSAIRFRESPRRLSWGDPLLLPEVDLEQCTGCGLCETRCPAAPSAIRVVPCALTERLVAPTDVDG